MKPNTKALRTRHWAGLIVAVVALAACGGGGDSTDTAQISIGTITGFGSVVVNGVHFDDSAARIVIDDQLARRDDLQLGMVVEVRGQIFPDGSGVARSIEGGHCLQGPIQAMQQVQNSLTVMGQTVQLNEGTVFGGVAVQDINAFAIGDLVRASCLRDPANGRIVATRFDRIGPYVEGESEVEIEGVVANLDTAAGTCTVGGQPVNFSSLGAGNRPPGFANGMFVDAQGRGMQNGVMTAERLRERERERARIHAENYTGVQLEGYVSGFHSAADFMVGDQAVDASGAVFQNGTAADLHDGAHVEVKGAMSGEVLRASTVTLKLH